jgi:phospholipid-translocating ATPase
MAIVNVTVANFFVGMSAYAWTWWLVFAVFIGNLAVWLFTVSPQSPSFDIGAQRNPQIVYSVISPNFAVTQLYGNIHVLFTSPIFWLCLPIATLLPLLPRYLAKAWKFSIMPGDLEILLTAKSRNPHQDWKRYSGRQESELAALRRPSTALSRIPSRASLPAGRPSMDFRAGSRTDMATGLVSVDRGFDFATEEHGIQIHRIQTNISERRFGCSQPRLQTVEEVPSSPTSQTKGKGTFRRVFTLGKGKSKSKLRDSANSLGSQDIPSSPASAQHPPEP